MSYEDAAVVALLNVATEQIDTLTRERDAAVDRGLELQVQLMTMLVQRDLARTVTDAMVARASKAWYEFATPHFWTLASLETKINTFANVRVALIAALTQGDA
jgi:hypothetical protein